METATDLNRKNDTEIFEDGGKNDATDNNTIQEGPRGSDFNPENGASKVPTTTSISFVVDTLLDPTTVSPAHFFLKNSFGEKVASDVSFAPETKRLNLIPLSPLSLNETYVAEYTNGITDMDGNPIVPNSWSFTVGQRSWGAEVTLVGVKPDAGNPQVAIDSNGNAAVAWSAAKDNGDFAVFVHSYKPQTGWAPSFQVNPSPDEQFAPSVHFDNSGNLHVGWLQGSDSFLTPWANSFDINNWAVTRAGPSELSAANTNSDVKFANESGGSVNAYWSGSFGNGLRMATARLVGSNWNAPTQISTSSSFYTFKPFFDLGVAGWTKDQKIHVYLNENNGWNDGVIVGESVDGAQVAVNKNGDGVLTWVTLSHPRQLMSAPIVNGTIGQIRAIYQGANIYYIDVDLNENGDAMAVWTDSGNASVSIRPKGGVWTTPTMLGQTDSSLVKLDDAGNAFAVTTSDTITTVKQYRAAQMSWINGARFANAKNVDLAVSPMGGALVAWQDETTNEIKLRIFE